jgi:hypothetical protein
MSKSRFHHPAYGHHTESVRTRFAGIGMGVRLEPKLHNQIPEIRALLRTDMGNPEIARKLGVSYPTLSNFCRRRGICDLKERTKLNRYTQSKQPSK